VQYPTQGPQLIASDPWVRASERIAADWFGSNVVPAFYKLLMCDTKEQRDTLAASMDELLEQFEKKLVEASPTGPFFRGEDVGIVEVLTFPWYARLCVRSFVRHGHGHGHFFWMIKSMRVCV
jgi:glutathione S-transferase